MTSADLVDLLTLLDFVAPPSDQAPRSTPVTIHHARDLEPVEAPARLTILFVTGEFPNPMHGGGTRVSDFIKLMSRHHTIHLLTVYTEHQDRAAYEAIRPFCDRIVTASYEDFEAMTNGLDRFSEVGPIDVIHYEWPRALRHFRRAAAGRHVYTCHEAVSLRLLLDLGRMGDDDPAYLPTLVKLLTSLKVEIVDAAPLDACIALTERDAAFLARFNPAMRYYVVNHGVTLDEFARPDREPEPRSILYIGNYLHYPNEDAVHFFFREVYGRIRQRVPECRVYIVGANPTPAILAYHDGEGVIVTGPVPDVAPAVQRAAVCVAPLVTGAGLRTKVIQYAALRRPAVITSLAAADLLFEHGADLLVADEPAEFADYVADLLEQMERARSMAASAYDKVCRYYDNRRIVGQLFQLYEALAAPATGKATAGRHAASHPQSTTELGTQRHH
jgi:glycosyltransferase involved in cell wall biosynthesis